VKDWVRFVQEDKDSEIKRLEKSYAKTRMETGGEGYLNGGSDVKDGGSKIHKVQELPERRLLRS
jgi:hypothetical protein